MNLRRIRVALTSWYVGTLLLILLVTSSAVFISYSRSLHNDVDDSLRSGANSLARQLEEGVAGFNPSYPQTSVDDDDVANSDVLRYLSGAGGDTFYAVLTADGEPSLNPLNVDLSPFVDSVAVEEVVAKGSTWRTISTERGQYRIYYLGVLEQGETAAIIEVGRSLAERNEHLRSLAVFLIAAGGVGLILATGGGLYLGERALRPVRTAFDHQRAFIADASHELRSPLTLLRASAEAVQRSSGAKLSETDRQALADVLTESDRMAQLVEDLLTLARLDEDRLTLHAETIAGVEILHEAERWASAAAAGQNLRFKISCPSSLAAFADREQTLRVLRILLDNAIHHTPEGGLITLGGERSHDVVKLSVRDTGTGISREAQSRIFDRFYREDVARTRDQAGGTGLGLAIARGIVEAQGGSIGVGATFSFSLPATEHGR
jgi:signal transduction histidine kinase